MTRLDMFLERSAAVGNENVVTTAAEIGGALADIAGGTRFVRSPLSGLSAVEPVAGVEGIDVAVVDADLAVASTGTVAVDSADEILRRATCLADTLVVLVAESTIVDTIAETAPLLERCASADAGYVAFITGASRTADIERVLTIGVHGPKRMRVIVVSDR